MIRTQISLDEREYELAKAQAARLGISLAELMRRAIREGSQSMQIAIPSFMVTASGWAPPIPPRPAVSVMVPASVPPKRFAATAANVS